MASLCAYTPAHNITPRRKTRQASTTDATGKRKVYGKRRTDAPRAVFEQRSPAKPLVRPETETIRDAVDSIQAQLADIRISETTVTELEAEKEGEADTVPEKRTCTNEKTTTPAPEYPANRGPAKECSRDSTATGKRTCQTMVEVRIPVKVVLDEPKMPTKASSEKPRTPSDRRKGGPRRTKPSQPVSCDYVSSEKANNYVRAILNETMSPVAAQGIQRFDSWAARANDMLEVVKLAEGSYGEVYKLRLRDDICQKDMSKSKLARLRACGDGVFKVVPLRAQSGPGSKKFTSIEEIVAEVKMLKYLDPIPGFARFREIHVVQGRFPEAFQKAWDHYKATKDDCLNPNPSSKRAYPDSQIWAIVEMDDAGSELEKFSWSSIFQVYDIFWGVAMALARAEEYALFEHRDLHLGNVCIRSTRPDGRLDPPTDSDIMCQSYSSGFGLSTLATTLIDYSLSRAELVMDGSPESIEVTSSDLDKKQIFDAIGQDEDDALLRDTYRHMRATLYNGNPLDTQKTPGVPGIWAEYAPRTNLVWLRFLLVMLLKNKRPEVQPRATQTSRQPLAPCTPNQAIKRAAKSCTKSEAPASKGVKLVSADHARVAQLKRTLEDRLNAILELLDLEHGHEDMCCAADLVAFAIDAQWLDENDFFSAE